MKNNADKLLRDKVEALDTLSTGIVYGKEDAWDKLQARMERKPARKIRLQYWVAAAVLLVLVIVIPIYYFGGKEIVKSNIAGIKTNSSVPTETIAKQQDAVTEQPEKMMTPTIASPLKKSNKHVAIAHESVQQPIINIIETQEVQTKNVVPGNLMTVHNTGPAPAPMPMKVVHINDVENSRLQISPATAIAGKEPVSDFRKMPVVHITDVVKEEYEIRKMQKGSRITLVHSLFSGPSFNDIYVNSNTEEHDQPRHLLKNIFNTQN